MQPYNPFRKSSTGISSIMIDMIVALLPIAALSVAAFGTHSLMVMASTVLACMAADLLFSFLLLNKSSSVPDGSSIITGLLLAFTLSPLTPWYVAAFGGATAILFGKVLWGGIGKNIFNPALVGREIMALFFADSINSTYTWNLEPYIRLSRFDLSEQLASPTLGEYLSKLLYNPTGALGEYSVLLLIAGGAFLVARNRITWHIPLATIGMLMLTSLLLSGGAVVLPGTAAILLGTLFMATDMPTSPSFAQAKMVYGAFLGIAIALLFHLGVKFEFMSLGILIMNAFSKAIGESMIPAPWGKKQNLKMVAEQLTTIGMGVVCATLATVLIYKNELIFWLPILLMAVSLYRYITYSVKNLTNPI